MDDGRLVREAVDGSLPAFSAIFDRHVAQVHDAALAMVRDRKLAMTIVQATFREVSERLERLQQPERLLVWLLAVTRFQAAQTAGGEAGLDRHPAGTDQIAERARLAGSVWEATADLPLRERALLDLHLRQHLVGHDLADALGVSPDELPDLLAWEAETEKGLAGFLLARGSDSRCPDLPLVLRSWDGRFTPLVCSHIAAHLDSCRLCREAGAALPSPLALYASAPQAPLPGPAEGSPPAADDQRAAPGAVA
jgi:DNA-directed RNA polymerase specialized sigma24 family protein